MKGTWAIAVATLCLATAMNAGTLTVYSTDLANNLTNSFFVGDTIVIKVTGDGQGLSTETSILGELHWNGAITDPVSVTQGVWLTAVGSEFLTDGSAFAFNQTGPATNPGVATTVITLVATAAGISVQTWAGTTLDFFGIYSYMSVPTDIPTGHSFTITPEPETAVLIALGLLGPALAGRAGRLQKRTSRSSD